MRFEWDGQKAFANTRKHKVTFAEASTVFYDPLSATFEDLDHSFDEQRFITIGFSSQHRLLIVSYVETPDALRIISARSASVRERKKHEDETK